MTLRKTDHGGHAPSRRGAKAGSYWLWGRHAVAAALANPGRKVRRHLALSGSSDGPTEIVSRQALERILPEGAIHQGTAILVEPLPAADLDEICRRAQARRRAAVVVLDRVQDPRNAGAVLRSAAALGAVGVVVPDRHAPRETGVLAKAASGALETVPLARVPNLRRALVRMQEAGFWCAGLDPDAEVVLNSAALPDRTGIVLGAEGRGLRRLTAESCDALLRIPVAAGIASLNVAAAAAIALYAHAGGGSRSTAEYRGRDDRVRTDARRGP